MKPEESVLQSVKRLCNVDEGNDEFDSELLIYINSVLTVLRQIGVETKMMMVDSDHVAWSDLIPTGKDLATIVPYVGLRVQKLFDPSASGGISEARDQMIAEYEWRIQLEADPIENWGLSSDIRNRSESIDDMDDF